VETTVKHHLYMWSKTVSFETIRNYRFEKLQQADCAVAVHLYFCEELCSGEVNPVLLYCKDEAQLYLNGHINTETVDNLILIYELPLHDIKVRICCTNTAKKIGGPPPPHPRLFGHSKIINIHWRIFCTTL